MLRDLSYHVAQVWISSLQSIWSESLSLNGLSPEEMQRSERFRFPKDQQRFLMSRTVLRQLLADYTGVLPQDIELAYSEKGKPFLLHPSDTAIHFNVTHSQDLIGIAFIRNRQIGLDLEWIHSIPNLDTMIQSFFSEAEKMWLEGCDPKQKESLFFHLWTQKEAYLKATGIGLSGSLEAAKASLGDQCLNWDPFTQTHWITQSLSLDPGYAGAVTVEGKDLDFQLTHWIPPSTATRVSL